MLCFGADLSLEDLQFKHLARLWRDACFPALRRLSLANNAFSSRYVRDWSWSFENERFLKLEAIDVSSACSFTNVLLASS